MSFTLPSLSYEYDGLQPYIDAETMHIHHTKHHQGYVNNLNKAIEGTEFENMSIEDILKNVDKASPAIRNNGGGHYNHSLFWKLLSPNGTHPSGDALEGINKKWSSFDKFKEAFSQAAATRFGSGWAWLVVLEDGSFEICSTPNQDNPIMGKDICGVKGFPILGIDVWEHAYYLKYQNRRPEYIEAFFNVIDWNEVNSRLVQSTEYFK
ncbi:MAG: superoxide dismutase [Saprospiraceae bacterium]|nr:superoxide dismutase [Saprospiraceae bacterium]